MPARDFTPMISSAILRERLGVLHQRTAESPLFNPVFQLSLDLSRDLEAGRLSLADAAGLTAELGCESLLDRANRLVHLLAPMDIQENRAAFAELAAAAGDFDDFAGRWAQPLFHIVFTAHPTFLLTPNQSDAVADAASRGEVSEAVVCMVENERPAITLDFEHGEALAALGRAQDARDVLNGLLFEAAAKRWPERWRELRPLPYRFATWVGYDMDGRTDIGWATCVHYRLGEKALRLERYAARLDAIDPGNSVLPQLRAAAAH